MKFRNPAIALASLALPFAAAAQPAAPNPPATQPPAAGQAQPTQTGTPGQGQTSAASAATNAATALATAADLKTGTAVYDQNGGSVGTVESSDAVGAVISTGKARVKIPVAGIGKNARGLVVAMTKDQLEAAAAASAKPGG